MTDTPAPQLPRPAHEVERLLSSGEAAEQLGIDKSTLFRWSERGYISYVRTPSGYRKYRPAVVAAVLENVDAQPPPD